MIIRRCSLGMVDKTPAQSIIIVQRTSGSNTKMRERITKVQPVWTKYCALSVEEEEELAVNSIE